MPGWTLRMLLSAQNGRFVANVKWRWWDRYLPRAICYWQTGKDDDEADICSKRSVTGKLEKMVMMSISAQSDLLLANWKRRWWGWYMPSAICYWQIAKDADEVDICPEWSDNCKWNKTLMSLLSAICSEWSVAYKWDRTLMRLVSADNDLLLANGAGRYLPRFIVISSKLTNGIRHWWDRYLSRMIIVSSKFTNEIRHWWDR